MNAFSDANVRLSLFEVSSSTYCLGEVVSEWTYTETQDSHSAMSRILQSLPGKEIIKVLPNYTVDDVILYSKNKRREEEEEEDDGRHQTWHSIKNK